MKTSKFVKIALAAAVAMHIIPANAGGYQLNDYSVTGLGRSYAGQGIMGDDYSAIAFNPAGMTLMKKSGLQQSFSFVNLKSDADSRDPRYPNQHSQMNFWQPVPAGFAQYNVNDKLSLGLGIYAPFGLKTKYKSGWFGSDTAILSKLDIVDFNFSAAYKLTNHWSVGASVIARYIYGKMTNFIPMRAGDRIVGGGYSKFDVHGWSQTGALGVMYEQNENTRFGFSWRLRSAQRAKGDFEISGNADPYAAGGIIFNGVGHLWANPDLPETFTLSGYHRYKDVGFSGTARWTHWSSSFPDFSVYSDAPLMKAVYPNGTKVSHYRYQNSWTLSGGVDYYYCKNLTFRFGAGWDESPTKKPDRRTVRIPDSDRWWGSVGVSYMKNNWQLDLGYARLIAKTSEAYETSDPLSTKVKYKNTQSNIVGAQIQYKF